jgi:hypothetical protein
VRAFGVSIAVVMVLSLMSVKGRCTRRRRILLNVAVF